MKDRANLWRRGEVAMKENVKFFGGALVSQKLMRISALLKVWAVTIVLSILKFYCFIFLIPAKFSFGFTQRIVDVIKNIQKALASQTFLLKSKNIFIVHWLKPSGK